MSGGGFTLVDFTVPSRDNTMTHEPTEAPLCDECQAKDLCFFDPTCSGCQDLLLDSNTTISQLFAVMRQWVPQTQRNMSSLSREVLRRGANVNDRDGLTDLSLLHFACKSGAAGVGNIDAAVNLVNSLLNKVCIDASTTK
ncbi:CAP-Gly domain-containing linker protein 4 [Geodia barretti]|uniref:CAP-Gly domain-containing linker protein 4 n=1 Tax=Geodia barretti TaxID=519541 RepID=A0AA35RUT6_GEOBA|nr:CAP-Gly domain-containing linker protein 4 [Geodia barretti]